MSVSALVVMGVSGSGKTTLGRALGESLDWTFLDADDLHPQANVAKMRAGDPLTDDDRWPWLRSVADWIDVHRPCVVACSALKRSYRDVLRREDLVFVHLRGRTDLVQARLDARTEHFMPASLLSSQVETLEPLEPDEHAITVDLGLPTAEQVRLVLGAWG